MVDYMPQYQKRIMWRKALQIFTDMMGPMCIARGNICTDFYDRHVSDDESDDRSFGFFHFSLMKVFVYRKKGRYEDSIWMGEFLCDLL